MGFILKVLTGKPVYTRLTLDSRQWGAPRARTKVYSSVLTCRSSARVGHAPWRGRRGSKIKTKSDLDVIHDAPDSDLVTGSALLWTPRIYFMVESRPEELRIWPVIAMMGGLMCFTWMLLCLFVPEAATQNPVPEGGKRQDMDTLLVFVKTTIRSHSWKKLN